jgi:hypothetical protein
MKRAALYREDLDELVNQTHCGNPFCTQEHTTLVMANRCHKDNAVIVTYRRDSGKLVVRCAKCEKIVAEIRVDSRVVMALCA